MTRLIRSTAPRRWQRLQTRCRNGEAAIDADAVDTVPNPLQSCIDLAPLGRIAFLLRAADFIMPPYLRLVTCVVDAFASVCERPFTVGFGRANLVVEFTRAVLENGARYLQLGVGGWVGPSIECRGGAATRQSQCHANDCRHHEPTTAPPKVGSSGRTTPGIRKPRLPTRSPVPCPAASGAAKPVAERAHR